MPKGIGKALGSPLGNVAGVIREAVSGGMSATGSLRAFREAGGSMRTQTWYRLFGEVRSALGRVGELQALDPSLPPPQSAFSEWSYGREGTNLYQVDVFTRFGPTGEIERRPYSFMTDRQVDPSTALDEAMATYQEQEEEYSETVLGATLTGLYKLGVK